MTSKRKQRATLGVIAIISLMISLTLAEVITWFAVPEINDTFVVQLSGADEKYHHALRARPMPQVDPLAHRILFLGDSFTYGFGLEKPEKAFPFLIPPYLEQATGQRVQVFSLANPSYSPTIHALLLKDFAPTLKPEIAVVAVDDSDAQDDAIYAPMVRLGPDGLPNSVYPELPGTPALLVPLARHSKIVRLLFFRFSPLPNDISDELLQIGAFQSRYSYLDAANLAAWDKAFRRSLSWIERIAQYASEHDITLLLFNYPSSVLIDTHCCAGVKAQFSLPPSPPARSPFHDVQRALATRLSVPYLDLTDDVRAAPDVGDLYRSNDGHLTELGHELFAKKLSAALAPLLTQP